MSRAIAEQREALLEFMRAHDDFASGRLNCLDGARKKKLLLLQLANKLNSIGGGASKTGEKWLKVWQDWKSDIKAKARKIKIYREGTGGGPAPPSLSSLEEAVLQFIGTVSVEGLPVKDSILKVKRNEVIEAMSPLAHCSRENIPQHSPTRESRSPVQLPDRSRNSSPQLRSRQFDITIESNAESIRGSGDRDPMLAAMRRQADAAEEQAAAMHRQAAAAERHASAAEAQAEASRIDAHARQEMVEVARSLTPLFETISNNLVLLLAQQQQTYVIDDEPTQENLESE